MTTERVSDERLWRCAAGEIHLDGAEQKQVAGELLAAREVVKAARLVNKCAGMTLLGRKERDPERAYELGANKAFDQCADIMRDQLAAYDAVCNSKSEGGTETP